MRNARFLDRCFVIVIVLALLGFFAGVVFSFVDQEPRRGGVMILLQTAR